MSLKAVLFDFNGIIIKDEPIHQELIDEILLKENLRPSGSEFRQVCLGRTDRSCLQDILARRGRVVPEDYITKLMQLKAMAYQERLGKLETLPIYEGIADLLSQIQTRGLPIGLVTGAMKAEVELVLERAKIATYFAVIVSGDEVLKSKPDPEGYLLAVQRLNQKFRGLQIRPQDCLAIEDSLAGIQAAKTAKIQVVGVANTYPFHFMQRHANWAVDYLRDLELDRVSDVLAKIC